MVVYDAKYLSLLKEMTIIWVQFYFIFCVFRCFHKKNLNSLIWASVMFYQSCARSEIQSSLLRKPISCKVNKAHIMFVYNIPFTCIDKTLVEIPVSNILKKNKIEIFSTVHWKQKRGIGFLFALAVANNSELYNLLVTRLLSFKSF